MSRSGQSSGLGKCSDECKTLLPPEIKEELAGLAFVAKMTLSEYVRDVLIQHTRGAVHVVRLRAHMGNGSDGEGRE